MLFYFMVNGKIASYSLNNQQMLNVQNDSDIYSYIIGIMITAAKLAVSNQMFTILFVLK